MNKLNVEVAEFMVWVIEITARTFFNNNKTLAYNTLINTNTWDMYVDNYEVTHTLSANFILEEISNIFKAKGVLSC